VLLPVSAPFHCALMKPAAERLAALAGIEVIVAVVSVSTTSDVAGHDDPAAIRDALVRPVSWSTTPASPATTSPCA
jgi:[acyl-carrier-protein] S-malonyltransferase